MESIGLSIDLFTENVIKTHASLRSSSERKRYLQGCISIRGAEYEQDITKESIILDLFADNMSFSADYGLKWELLSIYIRFIEKLAMTTVDKGLGHKDALKALKHLVKADLEKVFPVTFLKAAIDFLQGSFFQHYLLYLFVFTCEREELISNSNLILEAPLLLENDNCTGESIPKLSDGVPFEKWNNEQMMLDLNSKWKEIFEKRQEKYELLNKEIDQQRTESDRTLQASLQNQDKNEFHLALKQTIRNITRQATIDLKQEFETFTDDFAHKIEKGLLEARSKDSSSQFGKSRSRSRLKSLGP